MRRILVTGANKGIGLAIVQKLLKDYSDTYVFLCTRSVTNGESARSAHLALYPEHSSRLEVIRLDVTDPYSISEAASLVSSKYGKPSLHGIVNNAGIGSKSLSDSLNVNVLGIERVCDAFIPLLHPDHGAIVNVTSGVGPSYVMKCSAKYQKLLCNPDVTREEIRHFMNECAGVTNGAEGFTAKGLGSGEAYSISKAVANAYTLYLARMYPKLRVHACTPGFIETDMTRRFVSAGGKTPAELGMKPPEAGAVVAVKALLSDEKRYSEKSGRYFGSDGLRSPFHTYRSPGDPEYTGSD